MTPFIDFGVLYNILFISSILLNTQLILAYRKGYDDSTLIPPIVLLTIHIIYAYILYITKLEDDNVSTLTTIISFILPITTFAITITYTNLPHIKNIIDKIRT